MILGGAGLVGLQICRQIARDLSPKLIVIVALYQKEIREALKALRKEFPRVTFDGAWGDIFLRRQLHEKTRTEILKNPARVEELFDDTFEDKKKAFKVSWLVNLVSKFKPHIIIDAINTATAISYQDVYVSSIEIERALRAKTGKKKKNNEITIDQSLQAKIAVLLSNQSIPQLIRHVQLLNDAMVKVGTRMYLKIGTTGTGGMGLNIPYTHSEDKPSAKLMSKTAVAFAHTGLLFLMARTPGSPIVKEIKPAALIGYRKIEFRPIRFHDKSVELYHAKKVKIQDRLNLHPDVGYPRLGELAMVGVDTGENGFFTRGEFETITTMYQMEFVTPEEIAQMVVLEIMGMNTGRDVIAAIDAAVMDPSYRAGILRAPVLEEMRRLEVKNNTPSVALGQLGPPELSKLLYEAYLLKTKYHTLENVVRADAAELCKGIETYILHNSLRHTIVSIGLAILLSDGQTILRGPHLNIPEYRGDYELAVSKLSLDKWARKGWVDLRVENMKLWQDRFRKMRNSRQNFYKLGSAALGRNSYLSDTIEIGEVVGWIFNNDPEIAGFRIKSL
ncbi:hypothetical protein JXO59_09275 [candidate division KSB1 bacterium]|nr:hypothetical protein [candidate division KSB1 bacterium]